MFCLKIFSSGITTAAKSAFAAYTVKRKLKLNLVGHLSTVATSTMSKFKLYITQPHVPAQGIELLKHKFSINMWPESSPVPRDVLIKQVKGIDALFCFLTDRIDNEVLDSAGPSLKVVGTMSVGYDHIDVQEIKNRGILLGITPDVLTDAVAELTVGLLLATSRRLFEANHQIIEGKWSSWSPFWMCGQGLKDSTVGIVGFGRIGQEVAKRLQPFKVAKFLYWGRSVKAEAEEVGASLVSLDELLGRSDFVIVSCALTTETKEMFNDVLFSKMKPSAIFINVSRGGVVDQQALLSALQRGSILAAGLDVTTPEPLSPSHPLLALTNCVILPHIGSATHQARTDMAMLTVRNVLAGVEGLPLPAPAFS